MFPAWFGVPLRDMAQFYRQLAALTGAGVPLYQSLTNLRVQTSNHRLCRCLQTLSGTVLQGRPLSMAVAEYSGIFDRYQQAMIAAGEASGQFDLIFIRLAASLEQEHALRQTIQRELLFPKINLAASFLIPPLVLLFRGEVLAYLLSALLPLVILRGFWLTGYVLLRWAATKKVRYDRFLLRIPSLGRTVHTLALARFSRTLASLYAAGISLPEAIRAAANTCDNAYLTQQITQTIPRIAAGSSIVTALTQANVLPPMTLAMLSTGETTGSLDLVMNCLSEYYEQEVGLRLHQLSITIGVIATLIVGFWVAILVGAVRLGH